MKKSKIMNISEKISYLFSKINWGSSFMDAKAIDIMNTIKSDIEKELDQSKKKRITFANGIHIKTKKEVRLIASVQIDGWIDVMDPEKTYSPQEVDLKPFSVHTFEETYSEKAMELKKVVDQNT